MNSLNFLIKVVIELNNKLDKLVIEIYYSNFNSKSRFYKIYTSYYNRKQQINELSNNNYKTIVTNLISLYNIKN